MFREPLKNSAYTEEFIGAPASGCFMHFNKEGRVCVCVCVFYHTKKYPLIPISLNAYIMNRC